MKAQPQPPSPEPRPSPYSAQRPVLPTPRLAEYHSHSYGPSHSQPSQGTLPRPVGPPASGSPERYPGYERAGEYGDNKLRNGLPNVAYRSGPPPPPMRHLNGYQPPAAHPAAPHYASAAQPPAPQPYPAHQSPYGPVGLSSPHPPPVPGTLQYAHSAPSASPPDIPATMVRHSPQHSLTALNGGPPSRLYSVERVITAPTRSPPVPQAHMDPRGRTPPNKLEDNTVAGGPTGMSSGRHTTTNGASGGSGASASPSLKNLLS
jgi:hypothetical protein